MDVFLNERQQHIVAQLEKDKKVFVAALAQELGVAPETIRRDLDALEKNKMVKRVHGGAVNFLQTNNEPHFESKMNVRSEAKAAIGRKAAAFIQDGDTIMIDVGTTNIYLARAISGVKDVTIVTNSLAAADELNKLVEAQQFDGKIIVLGGVTNPAQKSIIGALTCKMMESFRFDKLFLSCGGITTSHVSDYNFEECMVSTVMVERANQVFLLADSSKIQQESFYQICPLAKVDYIICNQDMPLSWKQTELDTMLQWITVLEGKDNEG
ncbi:DeoR/GlpR family DNA-binding transcription regulator [Neobacillus kokaensis]|uniref:HTH-type transcriptional regulator n=1 Tax=Neobacillus kokaensis TaxID=2759023 RepID=A0ABQ3N116_9BACI|nr:DeoR/GlpR family DNA-binding transcription regulator [Neobacillus kokaensis]GHH97791.1 putative HTH-type transcriptional regulator [Neobacillus kokaensis]